MNGGSEAAGMCRKQRLYPVAWASLGPIVESTRAGEHRDPESILCRVAAFGLEVLMLKKTGRGVTRPLHWKNNKCTWAWLRGTSLVRKTSLAEVVNRGSGVVWLIESCLFTGADTHSQLSSSCSFRPLPAGTHLELQVLVYGQPSGRKGLSEGVEFVSPGVADDESAGCVRAGRAWRR